MQKTTMLAIIDPHEIVRSGLSILLDDYDEFDVVGQGKNFEDARYLCIKYEPDILIMDFACTTAQCAEQLQCLRAEFPQVRIFVLTNLRDKEFINHALQIGVLGYWFKRATVGDLVGAIENICNDQPSLGADVLNLILHDLVTPQQQNYNLTERQREVLSCVAKGLSNREIGNVLYISHSTVKNHVSKILSKLNVNNRVEAVTLALEHGLTEPINAEVRM